MDNHLSARGSSHCTNGCQPHKQSATQAEAAKRFRRMGYHINSTNIHCRDDEPSCNNDPACLVSPVCGPKCPDYGRLPECGPKCGPGGRSNFHSDNNYAGCAYDVPFQFAVKINSASEHHCTAHPRNASLSTGNRYVPPRPTSRAGLAPDGVSWQGEWAPLDGGQDNGFRYESCPLGHNWACKTVLNACIAAREFGSGITLGII